MVLAWETTLLRHGQDGRQRNGGRSHPRRLRGPVRVRAAVLAVVAAPPAAAGLAVVAPPMSLLLAQVAVANEAETAFASLVLTGAYRSEEHTSELQSRQ